MYKSRRKPVVNYDNLVSAGCIPSTSYVHKFGRNPSCTTGNPDIIWDVGGSAYTWPTGACIISVVSTSASDASAGAGARTVSVQGLDGDGLDQSETVTLDGTTPVTTAASFLRVNRMRVLTAGSDGNNAGQIAACANGTAIAAISASNNQTLMAIYTIPASKVGLMNAWYGSVNKSSAVAAGTAAADLRVFARPNGEVFQLKEHVGMNEDGQSLFQYQFVPPVKYDALTDLYVSACVDAANTDVSAGFDITLMGI